MKPRDETEEERERDRRDLAVLRSPDVVDLKSRDSMRIPTEATDKNLKEETVRV